MRHPTLVGMGLVRLRDSDLVLAIPGDYLRGKDVYDPHGQRMGSVEDLYIDRQEREVRFKEVGTGGFLGVGERRFLVPVRAVTKVSGDRVIVEQDRTERADGLALFDTRVGPPSADDRKNDEGAVDIRGGQHSGFPAGRRRSCKAMVHAEAERWPSARPEASVGKNPDAVWGIGGIMAKDILPDGPTERRRRSRHRALRAVDRLGLLGEGDLFAVLAARPGLRWLVDEEGARWDVLAELGRIGDPRTFEEAVEWALENWPRPEEAAAYVHRLRPGVR